MAPLLRAIRKYFVSLPATPIIIPLYDMLAQAVWESVFSTGFFMRIRVYNSERDSDYFLLAEL